MYQCRIVETLHVSTSMAYSRCFNMFQNHTMCFNIPSRNGTVFVMVFVSWRPRSAPRCATRVGGCRCAACAACAACPCVSPPRFSNSQLFRSLDLTLKIDIQTWHSSNIQFILQPFSFCLTFIGHLLSEPFIEHHQLLNSKSTYQAIQPLVPAISHIVCGHVLGISWVSSMGNRCWMMLGLEDWRSQVLSCWLFQPSEQEFSRPVLNASIHCQL